MEHPDPSGTSCQRNLQFLHDRRVADGHQAQDSRCEDLSWLLVHSQKRARTQDRKGLADHQQVHPDLRRPSSGCIRSQSNRQRIDPRPGFVCEDHLAAGEALQFRLLSLQVSTWWGDVPEQAGGLVTPVGRPRGVRSCHPNEHAQVR